MDGAGPSAGLDTMAEDLDQLKYDVGELKDLLSNNKGDVNHIRRIVLACERDMEDFLAVRQCSPLAPASCPLSMSCMLWQATNLTLTGSKSGQNCPKSD